MSETPQYDLTRDKLPRGLSYPLKRSLLDDVLRKESVIDAVYSVRYLYGQGEGLNALDAMFSPERNGAHHSVAGKSLVTIWAVQNSELRFFQKTLVAEGLPLLCLWLARTKHAGNTWRSMNHGFRLSIHGDALHHAES